MTTRPIHKILFAALFLLLLLPLVLYKLDVEDEFRLEGAYNTVEEPRYTFSGYLREEFQTQYDKYWNSAFGFRGFFVRLHHQLLFTFFNESMVNGVEAGKNNYLFETAYIDAFYGYDFIGKQAIEKRCEELKALRDTLANHGCRLLIVLTPGKASFYPEQIASWHVPSGNPTNHDTYCAVLGEKQIPFIDFQRWFIENKQHAPYPLFPKTGIHWSHYSMIHVTDSLTRYIETLIQKDLPEMVIDSMEVSETCRDTDDDIEDALNLFFPIEKPLMAYPRYHFTTEGKHKPRVMVIADSFYWTLYNSGIIDGIFSNKRFLYYNKESYPEHLEKKTFSYDIDIAEELKSTELVIILSNEPNLNHLGWGFASETLQLFRDPAAYKKSRKIKSIKDKMNDSPDWLKTLQQKADESGRTLEEVMNEDAEWMYENS